MLPISISPGVWLLIVCVLVQVFYAAYYFLPFSRRPEPAEPSPGTADTEPVSVIVCAHNELDNLRVLVPLLLQQDYPAGF
ncbi:MAG TPA: hypothetical protein VF598_10840, partial [Hymenobacter sp.]